MSETTTTVDSPGTPTDAGGDAQRVLVLAPFGQDAAAVRQTLAAANLDSRVCADADELCQEIVRGAAAVVITEEALDDERRQRISATLADEPAWSDLPLLIMTSHVRPDGDHWRVLQGIRGTTYLVVLQRPLDSATLVSAVRVAVDARRRQYQMRDELAARQQAEALLRENMGFVEKILVSSLNGLYIYDLEEGLNVFVNPTYASLTGYTLEELRAMSGDEFFALFHVQDQPRIAAHLQALRKAADGEIHEIEYRFRCKGGDWRWYLSRDGAFSRTDDGSVRQIIGSFLDLTERKHVERALSAANETLEARVAERAAVAEQRARDLQRLAAQLSEAEHRERQRLAMLLHDDLQQLLLGAKLRLPVLVEGPQQEIEQNVDKIDQLLGECLRTSRNLTYELSPPVLQQGTLAEVIEWLGAWFYDKHNLKIAVNVATSLPPVPEHLRVFLFQAVRELLLNVIKHAGRMEARLELSFHSGALSVQVEDDGGEFEPDCVATRIQHPEGFGLFNIQQRLEALQGRLDIKKGRLGGGCFRMIVPVGEATEVSTGSSESEVAEPAFNGKPDNEPGDIRLLVVDDHQVVREGLAQLLNRQQGLVVVGLAGDGAQAIQQVETLHPDAIVMDIEMPNMNGIEATRQIKRRHASTVVVGLTLHEQGAALRGMFDAGVDDCVSKHAAAKDIIAAIRRTCRRAGEPS